MLLTLPGGPWSTWDIIAEIHYVLVPVDRGSNGEPADCNTHGEAPVQHCAVVQSQTSDYVTAPE